MIRITMIICTLVLLAGCGGSAGHVDAAEVRDLTGLDAPTFRSYEIIPALTRLYGQADTLLVSDAVATRRDTGASSLAITMCSGDTCISSDEVYAFNILWNLEIPPREAWSSTEGRASSR